MARFTYQAENTVNLRVLMKQEEQKKTMAE